MKNVIKVGCIMEKVKKIFNKNITYTFYDTEMSKKVIMEIISEQEEFLREIIHDEEVNIKYYFRKSKNKKAFVTQIEALQHLIDAYLNFEKSSVNDYLEDIQLLYYNNMSSGLETTEMELEMEYKRIEEIRENYSELKLQARNAIELLLLNLREGRLN